MIVSLIVGISLLYIPKAKEYAIMVYEWLLESISWLERTQLTPYNYPAWILLSISVFILLTIVIIVIVVKKSSKPEYTTYVEDTIYETTWRWKWKKNEISDLQCYCPTCDAVLVYDDTSCHSKYTEVVKTDFICENCKSKMVSSIYGGNKNYAFNAIKREIEKRIKIKGYKY